MKFIKAHKILSAFGALIVLIVIIIAATAGGGGSKPVNSPAPAAPSPSAPAAAPSTPAPAPSTKAPAPTSAPTTPAPSTQAADTVTFKVTGYAPKGYMDPSITYGPAGSTENGWVGMNKTVTIPSKAPMYYAINAQLSDAGGDITVQILVNGKVVSSGHASGAANIASAEISQDLFSGDWQDTNAA